MALPRFTLWRPTHSLSGSLCAPKKLNLTPTTAGTAKNITYCERTKRFVEIRVFENETTFFFFSFSPALRTSFPFFLLLYALLPFVFFDDSEWRLRKGPAAVPPVI